MTSGPFPISAAPSSAYDDDLAAVVVRRLEKRSVGTWGLLKTILLGVPSFGLLPLLAWPLRFREYGADETLAMQELAQWAKLRGRQPAAVGPLLAAAEDTALSPLPFIFSLIVAALIVGVFAIQFMHMSAPTDGLVSSLLSWTYSVDSRFTGSSPLSQREFVYRVWVIGLSIGYAVQWIHIRTHAADVKRFVERFGPIAEAEGLPGVKLPVRGHAYFRPIWILAAVILALYGAWWGIPMVLAGMAQKRYTRVTGKFIRNELAKRVKDVVMLRQMPAMLTTATSGLPRCSNPRCLAVLRTNSRFCTRCGSAMAKDGNS
ncbi:MAG TPA: hypothetical protein VFE47_30395 [Tepidisphaeraceae bacterium]|jgi:hypothetical protein|nr:hypothetical protein [Tepidisphaeraceae bacterium]